MANQTKITVEELSASLKRFGLLDYSILVTMLVVSGAIGIYFGFLEKKKETVKKNVKAYESTEELNYLVGGRKMKVLPISISLISSWVSGIALLGTSTEVYVYGFGYIYMTVTLAAVGVLVWFVYLPVFHALKVTSMYEYLELRFSKSVRRLGSGLFCISAMMWLPIVMFVPALAFNQLTGVSIHIITPIVCSVCIFYTCVGGIKAVIWTDVLQGLIMLVSILAVIIKGTIAVGGVDVIWQRNWETGRLDFPEFTLDPTVRYSVLSIFAGSSLYWIQSSTANQIMMQRYSSLPSIRDARKAMLIFFFGLATLIFIVVSNGLIIFATYHDCDPITTKLAKAKDQLVPLIVMDLFGHLPGFAGFFIAGVLCAALSSLSSGLNSMTAVILEDMLKPLLKRPMTEMQTAIAMRAIVVIIGVYCIAMVFVVEKLGAVLQLTGTLNAISMGPECGLYLTGLFIPWVGRKGAMTGGLVSLMIMSYICMRSQYAVTYGGYVWPELPVRTDGCDYNFTVSEPVEMLGQTYDGFRPISHFLFVAMGCVLTMTVAVLSSLLYGLLDPRDVDSRLLAPIVRKFIKSREYLSVQPDVKERETIIHAYEIPTRSSNASNS